MKTTFALLALLGTFSAAAQLSNTVPKNIRASNTLNNLSDPGGLAAKNLYGIPLEPGRVIGNTYLSTDWKMTTLLLYDGGKMIEAYPARYEIESDQFEIKTSSGVKVLNGTKVNSFVWVDSLTQFPHYFVNGKDLSNEDGIALSGFFEVLTEGSLSLLSKIKITVKDPTYNAQLDMGNRDTRLNKKTILYYFDRHVVRELPPSKKRLLPIFGEHASEVEDFIKVNKLSLNEAAHLRAIFENYNARIVTN
jgi:hypothetical protein